MAQRFGLTWWGQRWIGALEALGVAYVNRLPRGRTYARRGTVTDLHVAPGRVTARVSGTRATPYKVSLTIPAFSDAQWEIVYGALASQLRHAAALLDGRMPEDIDEVLGECGLSLFPGRRELSATCTCPDVANPCKHVAAVHYVLAQTFDTDPFLLPALRGRSRDELLAGLRAARSGTAPTAVVDVSASEGLPLSALSAGALFDAPGSLDIPVHPRKPYDPLALSHRLGPAPGIEPAHLFEAIGSAADTAWRLASAEPTDDPVLAALYELGSASAKDLTDATGLRIDDVRANLRQLIAAGHVNRTGHARTTQYHA